MKHTNHQILISVKEYNDLIKLQENYHAYCSNIETIYKNILESRIAQIKNKWWFRLFAKGIEL